MNSTNEDKKKVNKTNSLIAFLNSPLGLALVAALLGAIGLFTWQRLDWVFKQEYLRDQVILDRQLNLVEKINKDVGRLYATAIGPVVSIYKGAGREQTNEAVTQYNDQQVDWFSAYPAHEALLVFYFSPEVSGAFKSEVVGAYEKLDPQIYRYQLSPDQEHYRNAYQSLKNLNDALQSWNSLALQNLGRN